MTRTTHLGALPASIDVLRPMMRRLPPGVRPTFDLPLDACPDDVRAMRVYLPRSLSVLSIGADAKTIKGAPMGYRTAVLYLTPHLALRRHVRRLTRGRVDAPNACPHACPGCIAACLHRSGRSRHDGGIHACRLNRHMVATWAPSLFRGLLLDQVRRHVRSSFRAGVRPLVRLCGTSDEDRAAWAFECICLGAHPYDYTKDHRRALRHLTTDLGGAYPLTLSWAPGTHDACEAYLRQGGNVAVAFDLPKGAPLPASWVVPGTTHRAPVIDGDLHDVRLPEVDGEGVVVGLRYKVAGTTSNAARRHRAALQNGWLQVAR